MIHVPTIPSGSQVPGGESSVCLRTPSGVVRIQRTEAVVCNYKPSLCSFTVGQNPVLMAGSKEQMMEVAV